MMRIVCEKNWIWPALVVGALAVMVITTAIGCAMFNALKYRGPESDHFDGSVFCNDPSLTHGFRDFLKWRLTRDPGTWPEWVEIKRALRPPKRVAGRDLRLTFINHSTVLLQTEGFNILTDPIWSERASPVSRAGPKRVKAAGLRFEDLPPIDLVLVSHNHYDHMDVPTLRRLHQDHGPIFVTTLGNAALLRKEGIPRAIEQDWWDSRQVTDGLTVTCTPAVHFSSRGPSDRNRSLWGGFLITAGESRIFFGGDTGYGTHFCEIRERFGPVRLAMLPIGAYEPQWFMQAVHLSPKEALQAHLDLEAGTGLGIHFGTFQLADDSYEQPLLDLADVLKELAPATPRFWALDNGTVTDVP